MLARVWAGILTGAVVLLLGCGEETTGYGAFVKRLQAIRCDALFDCCNADEIAAYAGTFHDRKSCRDSLPDFGGLIPTYLRFDATQAAVCVSALEAELSSCAPPVHYERTSSGTPYLPPACQTVLVGTTPAGAECADSDTCAPGTLCVAESTAEGAIRHCMAGRSEGQTCDYYGMPCAPDFYCSGSPAVCTKPGKVGAACVSSGACESQSCDGVCKEVTGRSLVCNNESLHR